jgi:hypothetical protein
MGRAQTGRPISIPIGSGMNSTCQDFDGRRIYIPSETIINRMLSEGVKNAINNSWIGYYGRGHYGRYKYGSQPGIYDHDFYGAAIYN